MSELPSPLPAWQPAGPGAHSGQRAAPALEPSLLRDTRVPQLARSFSLFPKGHLWVPSHVAWVQREQGQPQSPLN